MRLDDAATQPLHDALAASIGDHQIPGLVALLSTPEGEHLETLGTLAYRSPARMQRDTIFRISSTTKPIAAVATMRLVEQGKLSLDGPLEQLLPELAHRQVLKRIDGPLDDTVPAARPITLRDLLDFQLGVGIVFSPKPSPLVAQAEKLDLVAFGPPSPKRQPAPDEWLRRFATLPSMVQPGTRWLYNTGMELLTVVLERAAGKPADAVLRELVFEPLGMRDTDFFVPPEKRARFATSYGIGDPTDVEHVFDSPDGQWSTRPAFCSCAGGLVSTVDDLRAFGELLLGRGSRGKVTLLKPETVTQMTTNQISAEVKTASPFFPNFWDGRGWGLGMQVLANGRFGWDGGLGTSFGCDPRANLVAILLTQHASPPQYSPLYQAFWSGIDALMAPAH